MEKAATFSIIDSFQITGRGLVAMGKILEGSVNTGQQISIDIEGKKYLLKISGVDIGKCGNAEDYFIGLHLRNGNTTSIQIELSKIKLEPQIAEIFE